MLTWALSAGVVVLVSVVSFSAGYVVGREMGREGVGCQRVGGWGGGCAKEVVGAGLGGGGAGPTHPGMREGLGRGLRRLRVVAGG